MAAASTFSAGKLLFLVGNGEDPEVFTEPCAVLTASMTINKELTDTLIPDCADPDAIGWIQRDAISNSMNFSLEGLATKEAVATFSDAVMGAGPINCRIQLVGGGSGGATPDYRWSGAFQFASLEMGRSRGEKITFTVDIQSDGIVTAASVAALA